jgi:hypothetical protein
VSKTRNQLKEKTTMEQWYQRICDQASAFENGEVDADHAKTLISANREIVKPTPRKAVRWQRQ